MPLISVIIPVYQSENFLAQCLDSIMEQTYSQLEIILINDCSTDRCMEICNTYACQDNRVEVINLKINQGVSFARNKGIKAARGEWIAFIDSDDWIEPDYFEILLHLAITTGADIVACDYIATKQNNTFMPRKKETVLEMTNKQALHQLGGVNHLHVIVVWGKIYRKKILEGIYFPSDRNIGEDVSVTYRWIHRARKYVLTTQPLYYYRIRPDSLSSEPNKLHNMLNLIELLEERAEFFKNVELKDLHDLTWREIFCHYMDNEKQVQWEGERLRRELRKTRQTWKLKILYEVYPFFPQLVKWIYRSYHNK